MSRLANALEGSQGREGWAGVPYVRIDGDTDGRDRQAACLRFSEDPSIRVALLSITAAGERYLHSPECCSQHLPAWGFETLRVSQEC